MFTPSGSPSARAMEWFDSQAAMRTRTMFLTITWPCDFGWDGFRSILNESRLRKEYFHFLGEIGMDWSLLRQLSADLITSITTVFVDGTTITKRA
jgi:hypothetical protein